jgi:putative ABC transport system permease protein
MVSIAVFIGVLGVVTLLSSGDLLIRQLRKDLQKDELAMLRAYVSTSSGTEVDNAAYLEMLRELPGVTEVQGNAHYPISWKLPNDDKFSEGVIRAFSKPFGEIPLEPPRLTAEGHYPAPGNKEVAIERRMAKKYGLKVGDKLVLRVLGGAAEGASDESAAREETWTIAGILFHSYTYFGVNDFIPNETSVYATYEDAQYIAGFTGYNSIYARYTDFPTAEREANNFVAAISENTPYVVTFSYAEDPAKNLFIQISQQYTGVISMLAVVAMVVSGFLVANVISTIVLEQNRQIGVMKSLGATRGDNFMMYAGIAFVYGLMGLVPGVLLGMPLGYKLAEYTAQFPNAFIERFSVSPLGVGMGVAMGLLVPVLAAAVPVYNGTKVTILEAMTDLGISTSYGTGRAARLIGALPLPVNVRQALSNVFQKKGRLALTVITLTFAVAAFMGVFAVFSSLSEALGGIFDAYGYEIQVNPTDIQDFDEVQELVLGNVEGVQAVYPGVAFAMQVEGYKDQWLGTNQLQVLGIDPRTDTFALDLKEGTAWQEDPDREGIVLTSSVAKGLGKKAGDTLVVAAGGKSTELEIIGIDRFPFDQAFMEWRALASLGGLTLGAPTPNQYWVPLQVEGYAGTLPGGQVVAVGFDEQVGGFLSFEAGANFVADRPGVIVSTDMATNGGYQVGDSLTLSVGGQAKSYPITGIFSLPPQMASGDTPPDILGIFWRELATLEGRDLGGQAAPNLLYVRLKNADATAAQVDESIEAITDVLVDHGVTANFTNQVAAAEESAQQVLAFGVMFNMTSAVMAAVGAIGLLSTLSMSVFERQKEIGVMRAIGAGSITVAGQFLVEGILVGVVAWLIGAPLSYFLGLGLLKAMPFGFIEFSYPPINLAIGLIGMLVIATIASLWPSINAARKTVSEIIRYQ